MKKCLVYLGKHSANMYFVHALFLYHYLTDFIYEMPYFLITYVLLIGISLGTSVLVEWIKKLVHFNQAVDRIIKSIVK